MEYDDNGRGIFYGVIGVATLVVAIVGATFAYFSASAAANNAIEVGTTEIKLQLKDEKRNFRTDMIPVDSEHQNFKVYPGLISAAEKAANKKGPGTCTDVDGNAICGVYEFTIWNPSETVSQTVYGGITVTESGFTNMMYAVFKGGADAIEAAGGFDVKTQTANQKVTADGVGVGDIIIAKKKFEAKDQLDSWATWTEQTLAPGTGQTYTVIVWLQEAQGANNSEQKQKLTAAINFNTGTDKGVTGNLSAAS